MATELAPRPSLVPKGVSCNLKVRQSMRHDVERRPHSPVERIARGLEGDEVVRDVGQESRGLEGGDRFESVRGQGLRVSGVAAGRLL